MAAGELKDILELVVTTVEAITPYAVSGTPAPTTFRKSGGPTLEAAQSRQFDVLVVAYVKRNDTGTTASAAFCEREATFVVRVLFRQGADAASDFHVVVWEDVRRIQDRVVRAVRENGGGVFACWCPEPATPEPAEDPQSLFVNIPFAVQFNDSEYISGA